METFLYIVLGASVGGAIAWFAARTRQSALLAGRLAEAEARGKSAEAITGELRRELDQKGAEISRLRAELDGERRSGIDLREASARLSSDTESKQKRLIELENTNQALSTERDGLLRDQADFRARIAELNTTLDKERTQSKEKLVLLSEAREQLSNQFKALAGEILDEKSKKFTDQNQSNIGTLLSPIKQQLTDFKSKIEEVYFNEAKDRSALSEQVRQLIQLNHSLSQDAQNLTQALKGDRKAQGNWGEIILDDVLEKAGLVPGQHYKRQDRIKSEDGQSHLIPDVVIHLPGDRHLVIDSKMTLPDYRAFASAESDEERTVALKKHLTSIRAHIKGLSDKNYQSLYGLKSLDFVVMFIPLEPAFMLSITNDRELFQQAWDKNVLLVSPSTLLFVIRTVAYLWRQEDLSRNAKDISDRGAELYDKLAGFVADLQKVGERIQQAQDSYNDARSKLSEGRGNLIRQAEMLKELGVKPRKQLPQQWIDPAVGDPESALGTEAGEIPALEKVDQSPRPLQQPEIKE